MSWATYWAIFLQTHLVTLTSASPFKAVQRQSVDHRFVNRQFVDRRFVNFYNIERQFIDLFIHRPSIHQPIHRPIH
jgi:hypothetical protein